jgi:hypothetical protein
MHQRYLHGNNSLAHINSHNSQSSTLLNKIPESQALAHRRPSILLQEILSTRRPSAIMHALTRPSHPALIHNRSMLCMDSFQENGSSRSINIVTPPNGHKERGGGGSELAKMAKKKNRRVGDDALTGSLSALYAKLIVILGKIRDKLASKMDCNSNLGSKMLSKLSNLITFQNKVETYYCSIALLNQKIQSILRPSINDAT